MTSQTTRRTAKWLLLGMFLLGAVLALGPVGQSTPSKNSDSDPRVDDGVRIVLGPSLLAADTALQTLSGTIKDHVVSATYTGATNEQLVCSDNSAATSAKLTYSVDGKADVSGVVGRCAAAGTEPPSSQRTFFFTIPKADFFGASPNAIVTFFILVDPLPAGGTDVLTDPASGRYKYRIDTSTPNLANKFPAPVAGASIPDGVTSNDRTAVSFDVTDRASETGVDVASIGITIDGTNHKDKFICAAATTHRVVCNVNYGALGAAFFWAVGTHPVVVTAKDLAGNAMSTENGTWAFRVDKTPPVVSNIAVSGAPPTQPGTPPTTGRGVNITITADVADLNIDTNSRTAVFAQVFNETRDLQSAFIAMTFVSGNQWRAINVTAPPTWETGIYRIHARVVARDLAALDGAANTTTEPLNLDADPPRVTETAPPLYIRDNGYTVRATVTDNGTGVNTVKIRFTNVTGSFKTAPTNPKVGGFFEGTMTAAGQNNYTFAIPAANHSSILVYFIVADDKVLEATMTGLQTLRIDSAAPTILEQNAKPFRSASPHNFTVEVKDPDSGVDNRTVKVFYTLGTTFLNKTMDRVGTTDSYSAGVTIAGTKDNDVIKYYFEAKDAVGNLGNLSSAATPLQSKIDLSPPTFTLEAPASVATTNFTITWNGTDTVSGIETYTVQARVVGGSTEWVAIADRVTTKSLEVCADGGHSYEFRGYATDKAGNKGTPPEAAMKTTEVTGPGCQETLTVSVTYPSPGLIVDARSADKIPVQWRAVSTKTFTPTTALKIDILFSPDDGAHYFLFSEDQPNTGLGNISGDLPSCENCLVKVRATTLSGATGEATSVPFSIKFGDATADLDDNGLSDSWELQYGSTLGELDPEGDEDGDGLSNQDEAMEGTDPTSEDSDGDGVSDNAEVRAGTNPLSPASKPTQEELRAQQFTNWYWVVPGIFVVLSILFFVGLARRH